MDKKRGLGALALVFAGSILGRETVVWAWNKALDAIAGLFTGESPKVTVSTAFPWLDALGLVMGLVGIGFLISGYRSKRTRDAAQPLHPFDEAGFVKSLYLVRTTVEGPNTLAELYLRIGLLLFNATGDVVFVNMAEGAIAAFEGTGGKRRDLGILPPPRLEDAVQIPPLIPTPT